MHALEATLEPANNIAVELGKVMETINPVPFRISNLAPGLEKDKGCLVELFIPSNHVYACAHRTKRVFMEYADKSNGVTMDYFRPLTLLGIFLIIAGIILVVLPLIGKYIPKLENIPWIIVWVYRTDDFLFVTSPILIIISIASLIIHLITRTKIS